MSRKSINHCRRIAVILCLFLFFGFLSAENACATVKPPVHVDLMTGWKAEKGGSLIQVATAEEVITVFITISSGIDLETADFELMLPEGWEFVSGLKNWSGSLAADEEFTLDATVRASSDTFGVLRGKLFLPQFGISTEGQLDLRDPKITNRTPEWGENRLVPSETPTIMMEDVILDLGEEHELEPLLPEPYVEQLDRESALKQLGSTDDGDLASCSVRAYGRMGYTDDNGTFIGISGARIILWDSDDDWDDECGRGVTDWNGYYDISGSCGDLFSSPDIYIQNYAVNSNYVQVGSPYTSVNPTINNFCGTYNYGTRGVPASHAGAYQLYNQAVQANQYIDIFDTRPPMVKVNWPASGSGAWYNGEIYITDTTPWFEPTLYHEYGHFIMDEYAAIPSFNYCNGICDASATDCGHCLWDPENGYIHWMEGWPDFFADVQSDYWNRDDFYGFETHSTHADTYPVYQRDDIEGITAAILWDIYDSPADNQHGDNPRDNLYLGFNEIWNVATNYDPGGTYDYPMTIYQFWNGFYAWYPGYRQGLWSVYAEHHINRDFTAPGNPTSVTSSHPIWTWSTDRTISFSWSGATDNLSGVYGYSYVRNTYSSTLPNTTVNTTGTSFTTPSLADGGPYYFHIRTQDRAGNWNSGAVHRGGYYIDGTAPTGTIVINSGAAYTGSRNVTLTLSASDAASGLSQMRFGNYGEAYSAWQSYGTSKSWTLKDIDGYRRVYVQYRDVAGNISSEYNDAITLDRTAPTGTIVINSGAAYTNSQTVTLTLSAADTGTGVSQMRFGNYLETWSAWQSYGTSKTWTLKNIDGYRRVYVQYRDVAGNISSEYNDAITLDRTPPTGTIVINGGAAYTNSRTVTLALWAGDTGSGVSQMRFANSGESYSSWESYSTSKSWTLKDIDGYRRVYVQYRDAAGNISGGYDAIYLDRIAPAGSIVLDTGAASTSSTTVNLALSASDGVSGVSRMRFSNNGSSWCPWETYNSTRVNWNLTNYGGNPAPGTKTVYVQYLDSAGNTSSNYSDDIEYIGGRTTVLPGVLLLLLGD